MGLDILFIHTDIPHFTELLPKLVSGSIRIITTLLDFVQDRLQPLTPGAEKILEQEIEYATPPELLKIYYEKDLPTRGKRKKNPDALTSDLYEEAEYDFYRRTIRENLVGNGEDPEVLALFKLAPKDSPRQDVIEDYLIDNQRIYRPEVALPDTELQANMPAQEREIFAAVHEKGKAVAAQRQTAQTLQIQVRPARDHNIGAATDVAKGVVAGVAVVKVLALVAKHVLRKDSGKKSASKAAAAAAMLAARSEAKQPKDQPARAAQPTKEVPKEAATSTTRTKRTTRKR